MNQLILAIFGLFAVGSSSDADRETSRRLLQWVSPPAPGGRPAPAYPSVTAPASVVPPAVTPGIPAFVPPAAPITEKICNLPCTTVADCPSACAQQIEWIVSPPSSFTMECTAIGSCALSQFTFEYPL